MYILCTLYVLLYVHTYTLVLKFCCFTCSHLVKVGLVEVLLIRIIVLRLLPWPRVPLVAMETKQGVGSRDTVDLPEAGCVELTRCRRPRGLDRYQSES